MTLLREEAKEKLCGWQSTQQSAFKPLPPYLLFVQMLHVNKCHWITVSNYNVVNRAAFADTVYIYDSGWPVGVSTQVKRAVCSFYQCRKDTLVFELMDVRRQQNASDCGVLTIAYATDLAHDEDPTTKQWDSDKMRNTFELVWRRGKWAASQP